MIKRQLIISRGFTIVELLVVIVVIGILAAISIVSYSGFRKQATIASLKSDLDSIQKQLDMYQVENSEYPQTLNCSQLPPSNSKCLELSHGNRVDYYRAFTGPSRYYMTISNGEVAYNFGSGQPIADGRDIGAGYVSKSCPINFVPVPANGAFGTVNDFCVMKYEAKWNVNKVTTGPSGVPIKSISQTSAIASIAASVTDCPGCRLISEEEWLTIANNVINVDSNWSGGTVGSGYVFSGHNDANPVSLLSASDDSDNYYGTLDSSGDSGVTGSMIGNSQRRTLNLSNNEIIWDFAGNIAEITSGKITNQPGLSSDSTYSPSLKEWDNNLLLNGEMPLSALPPGGYNSSKGIGKLSSAYNQAVLMSFIRGGSYTNKSVAGVFSLNFLQTDYSTPSNGFRTTCDPTI